MSSEGVDFTFQLLHSFGEVAPPSPREQLCQGAHHCAPYEPAQGGVAFNVGEHGSDFIFFHFLFQNGIKSERHIGIFTRVVHDFFWFEVSHIALRATATDESFDGNGAIVQIVFGQQIHIVGAVRVAPHSVPALCQTVFLRPLCHSATTPKCRI